MNYEVRAVQPIPPKSHDNAKGFSKYPFNNLEVGQGFYVPNLEKMPPAELLEKAATLNNMRNHCSVKSRKTGKKFKVALYPDDHCWIQVWRES